MEYYILINNKRRGPYSLQALIQIGLTPSSLVWRVGLNDWTPAGSVPEISAALNNAGGAAGRNQYNEADDYAGASNNYSRNADGRSAETPQMPKTWLLESVLVTLFCCLPFGIVGIVYAAQVSSAYYGGRYLAAEENSHNAGKWTKWGFIIGIVIALGSVAFYVLAFILGMLALPY